MSWTRLPRWVDRVEVRLAAILLVLGTPVLAAALLLSMAYAAHEMLERRGEQLDALANAVAGELARSSDLRLDGFLYDLIERERIAIRISGGDRPLALRGPGHWFSEHRRDAGSFRDAVLSGEDDVLGRDRLVGSTRLEMAASLEGFTEERAELMAGFWLSLIVGVLGSAAFAIVATRRALRPLREATEAIDTVNANELQTRLPLRHTGDVVDRHAEALNQALDRLESGLGRVRAFSANVAHELRTPINRLLNQSGARLLVEEDDGLAHVLLGVQRTAEEMQAIVDGLLLLAQADDGRLRTQMREVSLVRLLDGLQDLYRPACEEGDVRLELKTEDLTIVGDQGLLVRALSNLIDNALGQMPTGGRIAIDAEPHDAGVSIRVCDTGPGVATADLERIFDRFVRVNPTAPRRGAGLGLPIARAIAAAHGGRLSARASPGGGVCFELWLPQGISLDA